MKKRLENEFLKLKAKEEELIRRDEELSGEIEVASNQLNAIDEQEKRLKAKSRENTKDIKAVNVQIVAKSRNIKSLKRRSGVFAVLLLVIALLGNYYIYTWSISEQEKLKESNLLEKRELVGELSELKEKTYRLGKLDVIQETFALNAKSIILNATNGKESTEYISSLLRPSSQLIEFMELGDKSLYVVREREALPRYTNVDPGSPTIYPGATILGESVFSGSYSLVPLKRTGAKLFSNLSNTDAISIDEVNYANVHKALDEFALSYDNDVLKSWSYEMSEVKNQEDINKSLGISANVYGVDIGYSLGKKIKTTKHNLLVTVRQNYYSVSVEPKEQPSDYFKAGSDLANLGYKEPVYVNKVDYGRMAIMLISSEASIEEMKESLDASFKNVKVGASFDRVKMDANFDYTLEIIGGSSNGDLAEVTGTQINEKKGLGKYWPFNKEEDTTPMNGYVQSLSAFLDQTNDGGLVNAVPIGYTLNYLTDNLPVACSLVKNEQVILDDGMMVVNVNLNELTDYKNAELELVSNDFNSIIVQPSTITVNNDATNNYTLQALVRKDAALPLAIRVTGIDDKGNRDEAYQLIDLSNNFVGESFELPVNIEHKEWWILNLNDKLGTLTIKLSSVAESEE